MAGENLESTVLFEHRKVVVLRHILAIINFLAILAGTIVTTYYVQIRGISPDILTLIRVTLVINVIQIALCIADYVSKFFLGKYHKWMVITSYIVGILWLAVVIGELVLSSLELGSLRIDLAVIAGIQGITALIAYVIWPALDYLTIQKMTHPKVRDDLEKRGKKAGAGAFRYVLICVLMVALQGGMLFAYKLPPKVYDIFAESRAIEYRLSEDGTSYEVVGVYEGTSSYLNIPAFYNNKPVTKILEGALVDDSILEQNRIKTIEFGTETVDENGNTVLVSNLNVIESGAIENDNITSLKLPLSIYRIEEGAISSTSLKNLIYEAQADFSYSCLNTPAIQTITIEGEEAGRIVSLSGMDNNVTINVAKDIYNIYRERNPQYVQSLRPIMPDDEFVVDFYTGTDYYIESIFKKIGEEVVIGYQDLRNDTYTSMVAPSVDTLAYIRNNHELGTAGNKEASAFRGWYYDRALTQECRFTETGTVTFTSDTAIYAKWIDEYTGTLNWGSYMPDGQERTLYWTDEDLITFPVIEGREGYAEGIKWYLGDTETQVLTSSDISENVTLTGRWMLDLPVIDIEPYAQVSGDTSFVIATDKNTVSYTYDENQMVCLDSVMSHPLQGTSHNGVSFSYSTDWTKVGDDSYSKSDSTVKMSNVPEEGDYILTVTVRSPYGETSSAQTRIRVNIAKKALDMGTVTLSDYEGEYSPEFQTTSCTGAVGSERVGITYKYYDENDEELSVMTGVKNVGRYKVRAFFEKTDSLERLNYETRELIAEFVIKPKQLVFEGWTNTNLTYNGSEQIVTMNVSGVQAGDSVNVAYEGNIATDAGTYEARAISVDNPNYSLDTIDNAGDCVFEWAISPKTVTVTEWKLDNSNLSSFNITYDGNAHAISAVMDGAIANQPVEFIYDENANTLTATDANAYSAKIIGVNNPNYKLDENNLTQYEQSWNILKKQLSVAFTLDSNFEYNSTAKGVTANISGIITNDVELFTREKFLYEGSSSTLTIADPNYEGGSLKIRFTETDAASYTASLSAINTSSDINKNYSLEGVSQEFTITRKTVIIERNNVYTYNGYTQTMILTAKGITAQDIDSVSAGQFTTSGIIGGSANGSDFNFEVSGKNADDYPVSITAFNNNNYQLEPFSGALTINKKRLTPTWKITDLATDRTSTLRQADTISYNYSGYDVSVELNGVVADEVVELDYANQSVKNVGPYNTSVSLPTIYENYEMSDASIDWSITPYVVNFTWTFNGEEKNVATSPAFTYSAQTVKVEPVYTLLGDDTATLTYVSGKADLEKINARTEAYEVELGSLSNTNYIIGANSSFTWRIDRKEIVVNWVWNAQVRSVSYNGEYQGPAFTLDGLVDEGRIIKTSIDSTPVDFAVVSISETAQYDFSLTPNAVNVGSYVFSVDAINTDADTVDTNYIVDSSNFTLSIIKANLTLDNWSYANESKGNGNYTNETNLVYNTKPYTVTTSIVTPLFNQNGVDDEVYLEYQNNEYTDYSADGYTARVSLAGAQKDNYAININSYLNWNIAQKPITVTWDVNDFTYEKNVTKTQNAVAYAGATSDDDNKVYDVDASSIVLSFSNNAYTNVGVYTAQADSISNTNYCFATPQTCEWEIKQKEINVEWTQSEFTYNATNRYPSAIYGADDLGNIVYEKASTSINVGTYEISISSISNNNYKVSDTSKTFSYEIVPVVASFTWGFDTNSSNAVNYEYDGSERGLYAHLSNSFGETLYFTYVTEYTKVNGSAGSVIDNKIKNAGTYVFRVTAINNALGNPNPNYEIKSESGAEKEIRVSQRVATFTWGYNGDQSNAVNFTYDGMEREVSAYVSNARDAGIILEYNVMNRTIKGAGSYEFAVTAISNDNYTLSDSSKNKTVTISARPLAFAWYFDNNGDGIFNGTDTPVSDFTYSSSVSRLVKAYATNLASGDNVNVVYNYDSTLIKDAGTYNFEVTSLAGVSINYTTSGASNTTKTVTINKQPVTISWEGNQSVIVYDGNPHTVTAVVNGAIDHETVSFTYTGGNNSFTNAGTHTVEVVLAGASNYTTSGVNTTTTLNIQPLRALVSWSDYTEFTYDKTEYSIEANVYGLNNSLLPITYENGNTLVNAGEKVVTVSLNDTNHYIDDEDKSCTLKVNPREVTIKWLLDNELQNAYTHSFSLTYDGAQHSLVPQVTGIGGETVQCTYGTTTITNVGTLDVSVQLSDSNYKLVTSSEVAYRQPRASLTINPAPVTIVWSQNEFYYDGTEHSIEAYVTGVMGESINCTYLNGNTQTNAGEKVVTVVLNNSNYTLVGNENASETLSVIMKTLRAKWYVRGEEATYNEETHKYEITVVADGSTYPLTVVFLNENDEEVSVNSVMGKIMTIYNPGQYTQTVKLRDNNYLLDPNTSTITVTVE